MQAKTNKREFLDQINRIIPWGEWLEIVKPCYYEGVRGNKPFELELMLRIHLLQHLYDLADMSAMTEVIDSRAFSQFCGVDSSNQVPDGDTIGRFRNILLRNGIQEKLFAQVVSLLEQKGLILKKGTIVDSTIIAAPSSTKNREKQRDPEAKSTKKGNTWHFGYKAHIGVDQDTGLIHHLEVTAANEHDVTVTEKLLHGEEEVVYGDAGYIGANKRKNAKKKNINGKKINYRINRRPSGSKQKSTASQAQIKRREREKSSIRSKVEHVFGVIKCTFSHRRTRYRGLRKQTSNLNMLFALANLYLADKRFGLSV